MIYKNIRNLREDRDLTQQDLANILHINRRTYSAYENGVNSMTPETLIKIADYYNTSVDYLLGRTNIMVPYPPTSQE
ncbi:MAG: helix-turn-helix domain-containing protein [Faecalibacterium sp.]|nr:helix-turn-helix domain-containing protein [Ruminococcus sp.]MCM1485094.1 helix-turn-helix domain-containing protein [Faecalibacterium sp.]